MKKHESSCVTLAIRVPITVIPGCKAAKSAEPSLNVTDNEKRRAAQTPATMRVGSGLKDRR